MAVAPQIIVPSMLKQGASVNSSLLKVLNALVLIMGTNYVALQFSVW